MQGWEYRTVFVQSKQGESYTEGEGIGESELAKLGDQGWELVTSEVLFRTVWGITPGAKPPIMAVIGIQYNFKRPK